MSNLRKDELLDKESYAFKIQAQKYGAKADSYRYDAYSTRSTVNGLFAKALRFKQQAYKLESKTNDPDNPIWMKVYRLKRDAFRLETRANALNSKYYRLKKLFYTYAEKEAAAHAQFTRFKAENYSLKVKTKAPGECGSRENKKK